MLRVVRPPIKKLPVKRPSWWKPEKLIDLIAGGEHPVFLCRRAAEELDNQVSPRTLMNEIGALKRSAAWGDAITAAIDLHGTIRSKPVSKFYTTDRWHRKFYAAMERDDVQGNIPLACEFVGVGVEIVYALMDKRNSVYDKAFTEQVRILEGRRMARIRENYLKRAETDAKVGGEVLMASMPSLHSPIQKLEVEGKVEHDHRVSAEVLEAAQARAQALLGRRARAALPESTESAPAVIDVESTSVPVSVRRGSK